MTPRANTRCGSKPPKPDLVFYPTEAVALRCACRLLCIGETWQDAGAAYDIHLVTTRGEEP